MTQDLAFLLVIFSQAPWSYSNQLPKFTDNSLEKGLRETALR